MTMTAEHTFVYLRTLTVKFVERYRRDSTGALIRIVEAEDYDLPGKLEEIEALHVLLGEMLGCSDDSCPCYAAGEQAQMDRRP